MRITRICLQRWTSDLAFYQLYGRLASPRYTPYGATERPFNATQRIPHSNKDALNAQNGAFQLSRHHRITPRLNDNTETRKEKTLTTTSAIAPTCSRSSSLAYCSGPTTASSAHELRNEKGGEHTGEKNFGAGVGRHCVCNLVCWMSGRRWRDR